MIYQFDNYQLDVKKFELRKDGVALPIGPQVFDFLHLVIRNSNRLVSRDEVIDEVWEGRIVSETTVSSCVKAARKILGDDGGQQRFIRTARGRGFQFIHEVNLIDDVVFTSPKVRDETPPAKRNVMPVFGVLVVLVIGVFVFFLDSGQEANKDTNQLTEKISSPYTIAVMPFEDMSIEGDQEYFGRGVSEEILNVLTGIDGLDVTSRTTAFSLVGQNLSIPEISEKLDVKYIVEGSIRKAGNRVRVTAQLIDAEEDSHLWSETYDRELVDIFEIQDEISLAIADVLQFELSGGEIEGDIPTRNMEAYALYLQGHQLFLDRGTGRDPDLAGNLERAIVFLQRAVKLDPQYAEAWADIASSYVLLPTYFERTYSSDDVEPQAIQAVEMAIDLDPKLSQAWAVKGYIHSNQYQFEDAEKALLRSVELNPKNDTAWVWLALHFATVGKNDRALEAVRNAIELTPDVTINYGVLATISHAGGDLDSAIKILDQAILERGYELGRADRALIAVWNNNMDRAQEEIRKSTQRFGKEIAEQAYKEMNIYMQSYRDSSFRDEATKLFNRNMQMGSESLTFFTSYPSFFAAYLLVDGEKMIQFFDTVADNRSFYIRRIYNPLTRPMFQQKVFRDYFIEIGMLEYWQNNGFPSFCSAVGSDDFICE